MSSSLMHANDKMYIAVVLINILILYIYPGICTSVDTIANGVIVYSPDTTPPYDAGTVVTYMCNTDFELRFGDQTRTCVDNGGLALFIGITPSCENTPPPGKPHSSRTFSHLHTPSHILHNSTHPYTLSHILTQPHTLTHPNTPSHTLTHFLYFFSCETTYTLSQTHTHMHPILTIHTHSHLPLFFSIQSLLNIKIVYIYIWFTDHTHLFTHAHTTFMLSVSSLHVHGWNDMLCTMSS